MKAIRLPLASLMVVVPFAVSLALPGAASAQSKIAGDYHFSCRGHAGSTGFQAVGLYAASPANSRTPTANLTLQILTGQVPYTINADPVEMTCANVGVAGVRTKILCTGQVTGQNVQLDIVAFSNASGSSGVLVAEYFDGLTSRECSGQLKAERL